MRRTLFSCVVLTCVPVGWAGRGRAALIQMGSGAPFFLFGLFASFLDGAFGQMITLLIFSPLPPSAPHSNTPTPTESCTLAIANLAHVRGAPLPEEEPGATYVRTDTASYWDVYAAARRVLGGCVSGMEEVGWGAVGMFFFVFGGRWGGEGRGGG